MKPHNQKKITRFLNDFSAAMKGSSVAEEILAEIGSDLDELVSKFQEDGFDEDLAVDRALEQMGDPFELASQVKREAAPVSIGAVRTLRYLAAGGLIVWTLFALWSFRAWTYGFSPNVYAIVLLMHLPAILFIWPKIIWRKNWLFGLIPAGLALVAAIAISSVGAQSTSEAQIPIGAESTNEAALIETQDDISNGSENSSTGLTPTTTAPDPDPTLIAMFLLPLTFVLLMAIQRRQQRIAILGALAGVSLFVEVVFQLEEAVFRRTHDAIRAVAFEDYKTKGSFPTPEQLEISHPNLLQRSQYHASGTKYSLFWTRPMSKGFSIVYSSQDDRIRIVD